MIQTSELRSLEASASPPGRVDWLGTRLSPLHPVALVGWGQPRPWWSQHFLLQGPLCLLFQAHPVPPARLRDRGHRGRRALAPARSPLSAWAPCSTQLAEEATGGGSHGPGRAPARPRPAPPRQSGALRLLSCHRFSTASPTLHACPLPQLKAVTLALPLLVADSALRRLPLSFMPCLST